MLVQSEDSESAQESLLRFKLLSIFLAPFSIFPYVLGGNNLGQGGPGLVFIFLILVAAIPLTWCLLFLVVSTVVNIYVQLFSNFSLTRNEIFLNFSEWMTAVAFIAVVLGTETLILKLSMVLYLALILLIQAHYLYILYKWFEYSSDLSYKYWLLKGLIFIFLSGSGCGAVNSHITYSRQIRR